MHLSRLLYHLYKIKNYRLRGFVLKTITTMEKGQFYSKTLRAIFKDYHKVEIGLYSYGGCFSPGSIDPLTSIGRYCSFASNIRIFNRNHPLEFKSLHPFFYNPVAGYSKKDMVEFLPISIGHDVWLGFGTIIVPRVQSIGTGAVIAAGSVVTDNIPPYAVAAGNPAKILKYRFPDHIIQQLLDSQWWEQSIEEIQPCMHEYQRPYFKPDTDD